MNYPILDVPLIPLVYVLKLKDDNWYVGYSQSINQRLAHHFSGSGAKWTQLHPPISIELIKPGTKDTETQLTQELIAKYGSSKVRGGPWCRLDQDPPNVSSANTSDTNPEAASANEQTKTD